MIFNLYSYDKTSKLWSAQRFFCIICAITEVSSTSDGSSLTAWCILYTRLKDQSDLITTAARFLLVSCQTKWFNQKKLFQGRTDPCIDQSLQGEWHQIFESSSEFSLSYLVTSYWKTHERYFWLYWTGYFSKHKRHSQTTF